mmetsp:Transcript_32532/g.69276  ORF Transcript_32532/g.69276 Transcript_32532/m.69276 type:complete len:547 (-) Transcript_32532:196-1836(-)
MSAAALVRVPVVAHITGGTAVPGKAKVVKVSVVAVRPGIVPGERVVVTGVESEVPCPHVVDEHAVGGLLHPVVHEEVVDVHLSRGPVGPEGGEVGQALVVDVAMAVGAARRADATDHAQAGGPVIVLAPSLDEGAELGVSRGVLEVGGQPVDALADDELGPLGLVGGDVLGGMLSHVEEPLLVEVILEVVLAPPGSHEVLVHQSFVPSVGDVLRLEVRRGAVPVGDGGRVGGAQGIFAQCRLVGEGVGCLADLRGRAARGLLDHGHVLHAAAHGRSRHALEVPLVGRVAEADVVHHVTDELVVAVRPGEADAVGGRLAPGEDAPSLLDEVGLAGQLELVVADVGGVVPVRREAGEAVVGAVVGEAAHGRVELAPRVQVHVGRVAVGHFLGGEPARDVVPFPRRVLGPRDDGGRPLVGREASDLARVDGPVPSVHQRRSAGEVPAVLLVGPLDLDELGGGVVSADLFHLCRKGGKEVSLSASLDEVGDEVGVGAVAGEGGDDAVGALGGGAGGAGEERHQGDVADLRHGRISSVVRVRRLYVGSRER